MKLASFLFAGVPFMPLCVKAGETKRYWSADILVGGARASLPAP